MPCIQNVECQNETGQPLAGHLHLPLSPFRGAALFAHCLTCSKDITVAKRIAKSLSLSGFAVLRFDFTGLAQSQGDCVTTSFHTNLADFRAAAALARLQNSPRPAKDRWVLAPALTGISLGIFWQVNIICGRMNRSLCLAG